MIYEKYNGNSVSAEIENVDKSNPYTQIGAKAFLSCKNVYEIKLPDTIRVIGDWAFAHMKELKKIYVPASTIMIGKDAFLDCDSLEEVVVYQGGAEIKGLSYLLASCITVLKAIELLDFKEAVEQNKLWCERYDKALTDFICRADDRDFQPVMVGWFNDEGEEEQLARYIEKVKSEKINLCFLRLKYDLHLGENTKDTILSYLKAQMDKLTEDDILGWEIIKDVISEDIQYAKVAVTNALLNENLVFELIEYLNNKNAGTEIVAYMVSSLNGVDSKIDKQFEL